MINIWLIYVIYRYIGLKVLYSFDVVNFNLKYRKYYCFKGIFFKINKYMLVFLVSNVDTDNRFRDDENENRNCFSKKYILINIKFY